MIKEFTGKCRFLSNFYLWPISHGGILFPSLEHAYQAAKTKDWDVAVRVSQCKTPASAKSMGRRLKLRSDWESVKLNVMEDLVGIKFADEPLHSLLKATCPQVLEEGNWWGDTFWGVCNGKGENHLGRILMKVRGDCDKV
jgi:ribA/ribD-fused uncharacterized protein